MMSFRSASRGLGSHHHVDHSFSADELWQGGVGAEDAGQLMDDSFLN